MSMASYFFFVCNHLNLTTYLFRLSFSPLYQSLLFMTQGRARGEILDIFKKCYFILLTYVDILHGPTLDIFIFGT